ncbi:cytochrome P450 family protein [Tenggerimyces flavus]|uniref:Cytochrome P450 n=1 Tax=Tenggerimyces flavus TaxID=1708749 RepID=A0ABV7YM56_9ACTN|nr:hypothetical protein [Tenggerimyces flavus]MBM7784955.1 cytochrome P450 [Tenggerimyces flavus]
MVGLTLLLNPLRTRRTWVAPGTVRPRVEAAAHRLLDRLPDKEVVDLVEHFAEGGWREAGTSGLIAYGIETLLANEDQLTALLDDLSLMPTVVEQLPRRDNVAELARLETEVALTTLLRRFPHLTFGGRPRRAPDGTLAELPIRL